MHECARQKVSCFADAVGANSRMKNEKLFHFSFVSIIIVDNFLND
mgnify:CR=1 FL=1